MPITDATGRECLARLITVLPGERAEGRPVGAPLAEQIGALAARTTLALQGLFHAAGGRQLDWDIRRAPEVLTAPGAAEALGDLGPLIGAALPRLAAATRSSWRCRPVSTTRTSP